MSQGGCGNVCRAWGEAKVKWERPVCPRIRRRPRIRRPEFVVSSPNSSSPNSSWVADITYVRLQEEFVYVAVVLDAHSRRVIGWAVAKHLGASLAVEALRMALAERQPAPGLIHHSDRGIQYACADYLTLLAEHGAQPSMSRVGNPYDNAKAESFMKTLKEEQVRGNQGRDLDALRADLRTFLQITYNHQRLHSALGYQTPATFETAALQLTRTAASTKLSGARGLTAPSPHTPLP